MGNVETFKAKAKLATTSRAAVDSHVESGAGGGGTTTPARPAGSVDMSKLPKHVQEYVEKSGMNQKDRDSYVKFYVERRGTK